MTKIRFLKPDYGPVGIRVGDDNWSVDIVRLADAATGQPAVPYMYSIEAWAWVGERSKRHVKISNDYFKSPKDAKAAWRDGFTTDSPDATFPASRFVKKLLADGFVELC